MTSTFTPEGMADAIDRAIARQSLQHFCERVDPYYEPARHTKLLVEHLEAVERGDIDRLMVFMPPRHGKTYHVSERMPAWFLGRNPRSEVIIASYAAELAEKASRRARGLLRGDFWPFPNVELSKDSAAVNRWNTSAGGGLIAAGVDGMATGFGAHLLIIDDPIKGRAEADSLTYRQAAWDWYSETARTRLMKGGRQIICQTRWHEDDLSGRILNSAGASRWTVLMLPAIAEADDPLGRAIGEELWPEGGIELPRVDLGEISSRAYSAIYQQQPTPETGRTFQRAWLQNRFRELPEQETVIVTIDAAWKEGVGNSKSVFALWGTDGVRLYVIDVWSDQVEYPDLKSAFIAYCAEWLPDVAIAEDAAGGIPLLQEMRRTSPIPIIGVRATQSKTVRAEATTPTFEAQKVFLSENAPWVFEWVEEHAKFPAGTRDDQVDTTSMAVPYLMRRLESRLQYGSLEKKPKGSTNKWQR